MRCVEALPGLRRWLTYGLLGASSAAMQLGCSSDGEGGEVNAVCEAAEQVACTCPNGESSTATCRADGTGTMTCACSANVADATDTDRGAGSADAAATATRDSGPSRGPSRGRDAGSVGTSAATDGSSASPPAAGDGGAAAVPAGPATPSMGCGSGSAPASGNMTIDVDGVQREYIVKVPANYDANKPYRLVFAWHGLGGTAKQIASSYYGLAARSADSAIFIAAQGLAGSGQQSGLASWSNKGDSDITFTRKMIEWAKASYCIDVKRVFSIGMSNGGMMSNIVGCELGDSIRAIAAMSGGGPRGYAMKACVGQVAAWMSHGNKDDNVPFSYGQMSRDYWTKTNHCGTQTAPAMPGSCVEYQGCDPGFPVQFCEFDGGHMVPSFAGEAAWKFFAQF